MAGFTRQHAQYLRNTLQDATVKCSERCLYQSAKWTAELSASLSPHLDGPGPENDVDDSMLDADQAHSASPAISSGSTTDEARLEAKELHRYLLAKSYFDCREFERCALVFLPLDLPRTQRLQSSTGTLGSPANQSSRFKGVGTSTSTSSAKPTSGKVQTTIYETIPKISQRSLFLALYAKYMAGEKKKEEMTEMVLGPQDKVSATNPELVHITRLLDAYFSCRDTKKAGDGWLEYLYGLVLAKGKNEAEARQWLIASVHLFPYNWGAWLELSHLLGDLTELHNVQKELRPNIMANIFALYANQTLYQTSERTFKDLTDLLKIFPSSQFLQTQRALLCYHTRELDEAETIFSGILQADPRRIDSLDHYSNILYVMQARPKLAFLAQLASATDKFRPETCCVIGNYYSLKSEHEKAVSYFRRALLLDRSFTSAWTLMGHEYVEMKNTHSAIESYRRAVDVNRKDYRAWYGLGQTYEILEMHLYALFYFQRAASLRPYDSTMWSAVASCYDKVGRPMQSIKAYKRALVAGTYYDTTSSFGSAGTQHVSPDPFVVSDTLFQIALMHEKLDDPEEAASYMEMVLAQEEGNEGDVDEAELRTAGTGLTNTTSKARMWLARWEFSQGGYIRAMQLANELCQDGVEVEEAKALIRDLRARTENSSG